eukprot:scaffold15_cov204-Amphora_coffeaeformis.AAC.6
MGVQRGVLQNKGRAHSHRPRTANHREREGWEFGPWNESREHYHIAVQRSAGRKRNLIVCAN